MAWQTLVWPSLISIVLIVAGYIIVMMRKKEAPKQEVKEVVQPKKSVTAKKKKFVPKKASKGKATTVKDEPKSRLTTLRNHTNEVVHVEFSPCGNYLATASEDRTLLIYPTKTLLEGSHPHRRINVQGDVPGRFAFSYDGKYIILAAQMTNQIYVYGISSKSAVLLRQFKASDHHKQPINSIDFSSGLKYLLSCSALDTRLNLWDLKGNVIASLATNQMSNQMAKFSPDGKFVGVATISTELKLWEVEEGKNGEFIGLKKAIRGSSNGAHKKTMNCLAFTSDSKQMVTGSDDGTWKSWNIDVNYKRDEDARCLNTFKEPNGFPIQYIAVSPNNRKVATISNETTLILWDYGSGQILEEIKEAHVKKMTCVTFSRNSDMFASSGEDGRVHVWTCANQA